MMRTGRTQLLAHLPHALYGLCELSCQTPPLFALVYQIAVQDRTTHTIDAGLVSVVAIRGDGEVTREEPGGWEGECDGWRE